VVSFQGSDGRVLRAWACGSRAKAVFGVGMVEMCADGWAGPPLREADGQDADFGGFVSRLEVPGAGWSCGGWVWAGGWRQEPGPARSWWGWPDLSHPSRSPVSCALASPSQYWAFSGQLSSFAAASSACGQVELVTAIPLPMMGSSWLHQFHQLLRTPDACRTLQPLGSPVLPALELRTCKPWPGAWDGAMQEQHLLLRYLGTQWVSRLLWAQMQLAGSGCK